MELKAILNENKFEFKKKFGQNFISDFNLLQAICEDAGLSKQDEVLEIGVGAGTLTRTIAQNSKKVVGYEIDQALKPVLVQSLAGVENATVVFKDFMKEDSTAINSNFDGKFKVVANLPYYITSNIIFKLIEKDFNVESLTLMVQKEMAERLVATAGTKDYGTITAEVDSIGTAKIMRIVDKKMFTPMPNVDSAIVKIDIDHNKFDIKDIKLLQEVIKASFAMRRKTLSNCLKSHFGFDAEQIKNIFHQCSLLETVRGEALATSQFVQLANCIYNLKK